MLFSKVSRSPHQVSTGNPSTTSFQTNQKVHDVSPGLDTRIFPQPISTGASNVQQKDINTNKHESIAHPPQHQHSASQGLQRQSNSPALYTDSISNERVQNAASSHQTTHPQQQQAMHQSHSHLASQQQLPKLHTTFSSSPVPPTHVTVVSPLPPEQVSVMNPIVQSLPNTHQHSQTVASEQVSRNISQTHTIQKVVLSQQQPLAPGTNVIHNEGSSNVSAQTKHIGAPTQSQEVVMNPPSSMHTMQSNATATNIRPGGHEYSKSSLAPARTTIASSVDQQLPIQQQSSGQHLPQMLNQNVPMNVQQRTTIVQQPSQLSDHSNVHVQNAIPPMQHNPAVINVAHPSVSIPKPTNNQDPHLHNMRMVPSVSSHQNPGDMVQANPYSGNQSSSTNMSEIHSTSLAQQQITSSNVHNSIVLSTCQVHLQPQPPVQMQTATSGYISNEPNQASGQMQPQAAGPQMQQTAQERQLVQQQQGVQASSQHPQMNQMSVHQPQQIQTVQNQRNQMAPPHSLIAQQTTSNAALDQGGQTIQLQQHPTQQGIGIQPHIQQANIQQQQESMGIKPHDPANVEMLQRTDQGMLPSQPSQYASLGGVSMGGSNTGMLPGQQSVQQPGIPLQMKVSIQNSIASKDSANNSMPPSRSDPNQTMYGNAPQAVHTQSNLVASHNEKLIQTNKPQTTSIPSQHIARAEESTGDEYNRANVGEQLMNRLEQISKTQENWQAPVGDCVDIER